MKHFILPAIALLLAACSHTPATDALVCADESFGCETNYFFYDLKGKPGALCDSALVHQLYGIDRMNGVRFSIYGDKSHGGHPAPGVVEPSAYAQMIRSIRNAKAEAGDGEFILFASKKLYGKNSFPDWTMDEDGVNVENYVTLLMDYFRFMRSEGLEIDVLGIDNEYNFNEGNITPVRFAAVIDLLKEKLSAEGFRIPLFIGPERYNPEQDNDGSWINGLFSAGLSDRMDIYGTHYYPRHHSPKVNGALRHEVELSRSDRSREFWATEPHWGVRDRTEKDPLWYAALSTSTIFDQTDLGLSAMMWWGYNISDNLKNSLMRAISLAVFKSTPVRVQDQDGEDVMDMAGFQTRAYRRGDEINLFIVNVNRNEPQADEFAEILGSGCTEGQAYPAYGIGCDNRIKGPVTARQWTDEGPGGPEVQVNRTSSVSFSLDIPARSITQITFKIK